MVVVTGGGVSQMPHLTINNIEIYLYANRENPVRQCRQNRQWQGDDLGLRKYQD